MFSTADDVMLMSSRRSVHLAGFLSQLLNQVLNRVTAEKNLFDRVVNLRLPGTHTHTHTQIHPSKHTIEQVPLLKCVSLSLRPTSIPLPSHTLFFSRPLPIPLFTLSPSFSPFPLSLSLPSTSLFPHSFFSLPSLCLSLLTPASFPMLSPPPLLPQVWRVWTTTPSWWQ